MTGVPLFQCYSYPQTHVTLGYFWTKIAVVSSCEHWGPEIGGEDKGKLRL